MKKMIISVILSVLCCGLGQAYADGIGEGYCYRFDVENAFGREVGIDKNYGTVGFFLAPPKCFADNCWCPQPIFDIRGHYIAGHQWASNLGAGVRGFDPYMGRAWGAALYYDHRKGSINKYSQVGLSLESLGPDFDFRVNTYFPVAVKSGTRHHFNHLVGHHPTSIYQVERAWKGIDAEIGVSVANWYADAFGPVRLYFAAGTYYYCTHALKQSDHTWGGRIRAYLALSDYIKLEVSATRDHRFHNTCQGVVTLEIPLDFNFNTEMLTGYDRSILLQPVHRNDMIVLDHRKH